MEIPPVGLLVAFSAGLLSFLSPCVLPLVPSYLTFITGMSLEDVQVSRRTTFLHALMFVLGFSLIFVLLGAGATAIGRYLLFYRDWLSRIGGLLVIVFGLYLLGVLRIGAFDTERRVHLATKPVGIAGTLLVGIAFGAGWTPCIGPILSAILTYAASEAKLSHGLLLLAIYSAGLAIPFLLAAVAVDRFLEVFKRLRKQLGTITKASGGLMVAVGILMMTGYLQVFASYMQSLTPEFLRSRL